MAIVFIEPAQNYYVARKICAKHWTLLQLRVLSFNALHPYVQENTHILRCENTASPATVSDSTLGDG